MSPTSVDLTYRGFEVTFPTKSIAWTNMLRARRCGGGSQGVRDYACTCERRATSVHQGPRA